jgi:hypothetical protein
MMVKGMDWQIIRFRFSREEWKHLNEAITAEAHKPRGIILDERKLDPALLTKLKNELNIKSW